MDITVNQQKSGSVVVRASASRTTPKKSHKKKQKKEALDKKWLQFISDGSQYSLNTTSEASNLLNNSKGRKKL